MTQTTMPLSRTLLAALCLSLVTPAVAKDKPAKKPPAGQQAPADVPKKNKQGVYTVFGAGRQPPIHVPEKIVNGVWQKTGSKMGDGPPVNVTMAFDDRAIAQSQGRVFENANPFKLRNSVYTFVILEDGTTSFGNPVDDWEVGTRHAHLSQGRPVVASGELVKSNAGIRLNMLSGTYMIPLVESGKVDPAKMGSAIHVWFDRVLRAHYRESQAFKVTFSQSGKGTFRNDKIFETERAKGKPRLPLPTLCSIKTKTKLCEARFRFASRNQDLCKKVSATACTGK